MDFVVGQRPAIFELLASNYQSLLFGGYALLVLDLVFNNVDRVFRTTTKSDRLSRQGLHENLHAVVLIPLLFGAYQ